MASRQWLYSAPSLVELADGVRLIGIVKRKSCAVIIPVHNEEECLSRHLDALGNQSDKDFDLILVHSPGFAPGRHMVGRPYGIAAIGLKEPLGAGAFYAGQRYALENGYETIILADVDALPQGDSLVARLRSLASGDGGRVFLPSLKTAPGKSIRSWSIHWYGAMRRDVLERSGLTYIPLFFGGEDAELELRMRKAGVLLNYLDDAFVSHPLSKPIGPESAFLRAQYDLRNRGLMMFHRFPDSWPVVPLVDAVYATAFFDSRARFLARARRALAVLSDICALRFWDLGAGKSPPLGYSRAELGAIWAREKEVVVVTMGRYLESHRESRLLASLRESGWRGGRFIRLDAGKPISTPLSLASCAMGAKTIVYCADWVHALNPALLLYQEAYIYDGTGSWRIYSEHNPLARIVRFFLSLFVAVAILALYLPVSFISYLRLRMAMKGYGSG